MHTPPSKPPARPCDVTLRDVQPADLPALYAFESDPAWRAMAMVKPRTFAAFEAIWMKIIQDRAAGAHVDTGLAQKVILADGDLCGTIGCRLVDTRLTIGYGLSRAYWGRGIASRALGLLLAEVPQRPLYATAAVSNIASIRVMMRHGFVITERRIAMETERLLACEEVSLVLG